MYLVKDKEDDYMIDKAKCIDIYLKQQDKNLKEATIKGKLKVIKQLLDYCIANEIGNIRNIQKNDVYSFVQFKNWASQSRSSAQFTIRDCDDIVDDRTYDFPERAADDHTDSHVYSVALYGERLELI